MSDEPETNDLIQQLQRRVAEWVRIAAPRIRDETCCAKLEIVLCQPQGEDDGTLYLDFRIDETITGEDGGGRVEGMQFR